MFVICSDAVGLIVVDNSVFSGCLVLPSWVIASLVMASSRVRGGKGGGEVSLLATSFVRGGSGGAGTDHFIELASDVVGDVFGSGFGRGG